MRRFILQLSAISFLIAPICFATLSDVTTQTMQDVVKIARAISVVQPTLDDGKYLEYAYGIYRASKKYNVEPSVLISITKQETSFREDLPEGAAGEIGICQIRKMWLKQPKFKREFGANKTIRDLKKPSRSFLFAAWILKELKSQTVVTKGSLPYWSYYNAVRFSPRLKYFLAVNKNIAMLKKNDFLFSDRVLAESAEPPVTFNSGKQIAQAEETVTARAPKRIERPKTKEAQVAEWTARVRAAENRIASETEPARDESSMDELHRLPTGDGNRWIPDALTKVRKHQVSQIADSNSQPDSRGKSQTSPDVIRASADFDAKPFFSTKAIED